MQTFSRCRQLILQGVTVNDKIQPIIMNKKTAVIIATISSAVLLITVFIAVSVAVTRSDQQGDTADVTTPKEDDVVIYDDVDTSDPIGTGTNNVSGEDPAYVNDPTVMSLPIFGTSLSFYTHKDIYAAAKIALQPKEVNGRKYIQMVGKGCKILSFHFYDNEDGFYNIPERRVAQGVEYVYEQGPDLSVPKTCKPELTALEPRITEESLFIFRSLR